MITAGTGACTLIKNKIKIRKIGNKPFKLIILHNIIMLTLKQMLH